MVDLTGEFEGATPEKLARALLRPKREVPFGPDSIEYTVAFERDLAGNRLSGQKIMGDGRAPMDRTFEMANRDGDTGGNVIVEVRRRRPEATIYLVLVEPGDWLEDIRQEVEMKAAR